MIEGVIGCYKRLIEELLNVGVEEEHPLVQEAKRLIGAMQIEKETYKDEYQ